MSAGFEVLMLGLKGSGKTTFLAALWHLLEAAEIPVPLRARQLQPDREYLNRIRNDWLDFRDVGRSPLRMSETVTLCLQESAEGRPLDIVIPDLSGEAFRLQWAMRKATREYVGHAKNCAGVLLFVHPQKILRTQLIPTMADVESKNTKDQATPWSADVTSTQVQLVELLQFIQFLKDDHRNPRVVVIVSAWDLIGGRISPVEWLDSRLPLLSQYLQANSSEVPYQIYGISALGGDLERDIQRLHAEPIASKRVRVSQLDTQESHDLTMPLQFLLGQPNGTKKAS